MIDLLSLEIRKYKCFASYCGFGTLKRTNVVLGKNNTGKSSILDPIAMLVTGDFDSEVEFLFGTIISESQARAAFPHNTSGGDVGGNHWELVGKNLVDKGMRVRTVGAWAPSFESFHDPSLARFRELSGVARIGSSTPNPFSGTTLRKISAERDIRPEGDNPGIIHVSLNGDGATNTIQSIINNAQLDAGLIQTRFLHELNTILSPDIVLDGITTRRHPNNTWEIFLDDHSNGRVALSKCGSGLKTIILVLLQLIVLPQIEKKTRNVYLFEELENNLHPSMQRRLLNYVHKHICKTDSILFLTTHSSVAIDLFTNDQDASVYSLLRAANGPKMVKLDDFLSKKAVLSELGVHASDILQANSIIWVEGPSDRVYLKRFMEIFGGNDLVEGLHYQFLYYGGRLLAHYSAAEEVDAEFIDLLRVNTNCAIIMDSDKTDDQTPLNATKVRIATEIAGVEMLVWVTSGREVENYIPNVVLKEKFSKADLRDLKQFEDIKVFLETVSPEESRRFERSKVRFAGEVVEFITKENAASVLDLSSQTLGLIEKIREWNRA